jgi:hypothetical protein
MNNVFENLEVNHDLDGVFYQIFYRGLNFTNDSILNFVEEHQSLVYQNKSNTTKFKLQDSKIKAFSKIGKEDLKDYRLIHFGKIQADNLFKYQEDYLHKRKSKKYHFSIEGILDFSGRNVYKVNYRTEEKTYHKAGYLLIDQETFAVARKVLDAGDYKEVNFTYVSGKWYLSNSHEIIRRRDYVHESLTNYNVTEDSFQSSDFVSAVMLVPEKIKKIKAEDFRSGYWDEPNIIPLPDWVINQLRD